MILLLALLIAAAAPGATQDPKPRGYFLNEHDGHGRIKRSAAARHEIMRMTGYPRGRPGYIIEHIVPLKRGGCDVPANMQWQTIEEAREKDRWE